MKTPHYPVWFALLAIFGIVAILAAFFHETGSMEKLYRQHVEQELALRTELLIPYGLDVPSGRIPTLPPNLTGATRVTVIAPDGKVVWDSSENETAMESHASRPEFVAALPADGKTGPSFFYRYSTTLNQELLYCSLPFKAADGGEYVMRTAVSVESITSMLDRLNDHLLYAALLAAAAALWLGFAFFYLYTRPIRAIVAAARRIAAGELTAALPIPPRGAVRELAISLSTMTGTLMHNLIAISQEKSERDAIFSSLREGVILLDESQNVADLNRAAADLLELDFPVRQGSRFASLVRHSGIEQFVTEAMESRRETSGKEFVLPLPGGDRCLRVTASPLFWNGAEHSSGLLLVIYNLTGLRKLENYRRDFVANVSHELKTPLTVIRGAVETLEDGAIDDREAALRFMKIISQHAARLSMLLEDILSLSDLECRNPDNEKDREAVPVANFVNEAIELCRPRAEKRRSHVRFDDRSGGAAVAGSRRLLEQMMINLIDNAVKYSREADEIEIAASADRTGITIEVTDHGPGIAAEHLPRLFERFYRVDKSRSRERGGTGLGLAIVKHIALLHSGNVTVASRVGEGTKFTVTLPVARP